MDKRLKVKVFKAYKVGVVLPDNVDEYAKNFLKIFNNVKTEKQLLGVENNYGNEVFVTCTKENVDNVKDWLGWFGKVEDEVMETTCLQVDDYVDCDCEENEIVLVPFDKEVN